MAEPILKFNFNQNDISKLQLRNCDQFASPYRQSQSIISKETPKKEQQMMFELQKYTLNYKNAHQFAKFIFERYLIRYCCWSNLLFAFLSKKRQKYCRLSYPLQLLILLFSLQINYAILIIFCHLYYQTSLDLAFNNVFAEAFAVLIVVTIFTPLYLLLNQLLYKLMIGNKYRINDSIAADFDKSQIIIRKKYQFYSNMSQISFNLNLMTQKFENIMIVGIFLLLLTGFYSFYCCYHYLNVIDNTSTYYIVLLMIVVFDNFLIRSVYVLVICVYFCLTRLSKPEKEKLLLKQQNRELIEVIFKLYIKKFGNKLEIINENFQNEINQLQEEQIAILNENNKIVDDLSENLNGDPQISEKLLERIKITNKKSAAIPELTNEINEEKFEKTNQNNSIFQYKRQTSIVVTVVSPSRYKKSVESQQSPEKIFELIKENILKNEEQSNSEKSNEEDKAQISQPNLPAKPLDTLKSENESESQSTISNKLKNNQKDCSNTLIQNNSQNNNNINYYTLNYYNQFNKLNQNNRKIQATQRGSKIQSESQNLYDFDKSTLANNQNSQQPMFNYSAQVLNSKVKRLRKIQKEASLDQENSKSHDKYPLQYKKLQYVCDSKNMNDRSAAATTRHQLQKTDQNIRQYRQLKKYQNSDRKYSESLLTSQQLYRSPYPYQQQSVANNQNNSACSQDFFKDQGKNMLTNSASETSLPMARFNYQYQQDFLRQNAQQENSINDNRSSNSPVLETLTQRNNNKIVKRLLIQNGKTLPKEQINSNQPYQFEKENYYSTQERSSKGQLNETSAFAYNSNKPALQN